MSKIKIPTLKCERCGHTWVPKISDVKICPKCKSARWNQPPEKKPKQSTTEG
jgi:Zn finger protein HypA/HybF involved in hydrogenase expression